jgi:hypothetical protein
MLILLNSKGLSIHEFNKIARGLREIHYIYLQREIQFEYTPKLQASIQKSSGFARPASVVLRAQDGQDGELLLETFQFSAFEIFCKARFRD